MKLRLSHQVILVLSSVLGFCRGEDCVDFNFTPNSGCSGKKSTSPSLKSFPNSNTADCAVRCYYDHQCIVFFYSVNTQLCTIYGSPVSALALTSEPGSFCYQAYNFVEYWVKSIVSYSYSETSYGITGLVGPYPGGHWHSSSTGANFVFEISDEIFVTGMTFYLLEGTGTVSGISLWTPAGSWHSVYSSSALGATSGSRTIVPPLSETTFKTKRIRIVTTAPTFGIYAIKTFGKSSL